MAHKNHILNHRLFCLFFFGPIQFVMQDELLIIFCSGWAFSPLNLKEGYYDRPEKRVRLHRKSLDPIIYYSFFSPLFQNLKSVCIFQICIFLFVCKKKK